MKISWFINKIKGEQLTFDTDGVPPLVDSVVYVNDYREQGPGARLKAKVTCVDVSIVLSCIPFDSLRLKETTNEERFEEAAKILKEQGYAWFGIKASTKSAECSMHEVQVHCFEVSEPYAP